MARRQIFWMAAMAKPGEARRAAANIERQQFEFYMPEFDEWRNGAFRRTLMFADYVFVRFERGWQRLHSTRGVQRLLMTDERPSLLRGDEIDRLRALEDSRGVIQLAPRLTDGDAVKVSTGGGGLVGFEGIVQGIPAHGRVRVLLEIMGRKVAGEFDERSLALA